MSNMLIGDPNRADALVDMSNIVRDLALGGRGPGDLLRLERVGMALARLYGAEKAAMFGVADESLLAGHALFLDSAQRRQLREWEKSGLILVTGKADVPLLRIAGETGLPIITRDRFGGHRSEFPWLNGSDDAILEPYAARNGQVALRHVTLTPLSQWDESEKQELDLLVQQGLSRRVEALGRYWSCPETRCPRHDPAHSRFVLLPLARNGRLVCDQHGLEMKDLGPRPRVAQLKIMLCGQERHRFSVAQGEAVTVGRSPERNVDLTPFLDETASRRVSREHLRFDLDPDRLTVTDLSRHGTVLILRDGGRLDFHQNTHPFTIGDRAQITSSLEIIRSGRRYPSELPGHGRNGQQRRGAPPDFTATL
jgi:FHA domain